MFRQEIARPLFLPMTEEFFPRVLFNDRAAIDALASRNA